MSAWACPASVRVYHRRNPGAAALGQGLHRPPLPLLAVGGGLVVVDHPHVQGALHARQSGLRRHAPGGVIVGADVGAHLGGAHAAVDGYDLHALLGGMVDGGGVALVVDGGKDDGLRPGLHCLGNHAVLGLVVLLRLRSGDGQLQVVLRGRRLGPGKDREEELAAGGLDDEGHRAPSGPLSAPAAGAQGQHKKGA